MKYTVNWKLIINDKEKNKSFALLIFSNDGKTCYFIEDVNNDEKLDYNLDFYVSDDINNYCIVSLYDEITERGVYSHYKNNTIIIKIENENNVGKFNNLEVICTVENYNSKLIKHSKYDFLNGKPTLTSISLINNIKHKIKQNTINKSLYYSKSKPYYTPLDVQWKRGITNYEPFEKFFEKCEENLIKEFELYNYTFDKKNDFILVVLLYIYTCTYYLFDPDDYDNNDPFETFKKYHPGYNDCDIFVSTDITVAGDCEDMSSDFIFYYNVYSNINKACCEYIPAYCYCTTFTQNNDGTFDKNNLVDHVVAVLIKKKNYNGKEFYGDIILVECTIPFIFCYGNSFVKYMQEHIEKQPKFLNRDDVISYNFALENIVYNKFEQISVDDNLFDLICGNGTRGISQQELRNGEYKSKLIYSQTNEEKEFSQFFSHFNKLPSFYYKNYTNIKSDERLKNEESMFNIIDNYNDTIDYSKHIYTTYSNKFLIKRLLSTLEKNRSLYKYNIKKMDLINGLYYFLVIMQKR